jgi:hypothetical protein
LTCSASLPYETDQNPIDLDKEPGLEAQFLALQTLTIAVVRMMQHTAPEFADALLESTAESREKYRGAYDSDPGMAAFAAQYDAAWDDLLARVIVTRGNG